MSAEQKSLRVHVDATGERISSECNKIEKGMRYEQEMLRGHVDANAEEIIERLAPRSVWEGIFGRRKG